MFRLYRDFDDIELFFSSSKLSIDYKIAILAEILKERSITI